MVYKTRKKADALNGNKSFLWWLGSSAGILAMLACYGTLAIVALLSVINVTVDVNEGLFVKIISVLLIFAFTGMIFSWRIHRKFGPLVVTGAASALLVWVFYGHYNAWLEGSGFFGLLVASVWDLRLKKRVCTTTTCNDAR